MFVTYFFRDEKVFLKSKAEIFFIFFLLLDQKEAKLKAERCFCPQAFTLARRSAGHWLFFKFVYVTFLLDQKEAIPTEGSS